ncbi:MAG: hypothetical protein HQ546_06145 [Planctomycetes bacterium]|nr:hypothetical protein [Planctomycetota bacterium]
MADRAGISDHLPDRLAVCMWDYAWYTMCHPSEPYGDLERALDEVAERGFNALRLCGAANWAFDPQGKRRKSIDVCNLSGGVGPGKFGRYVRWQNSQGGVTIDPLERTLRLFEGAKKRNIFIVLSNWIYQIQGCFSMDQGVWEPLQKADAEQRWPLVVDATCRLIAELRTNGLADRLAYVEVHNEQDVHLMAKVGEESAGPIARYNDHLERACARIRREYPGLLVCGGHAGYQYWPEEMTRQVQGQGVLHQHVYDFKGILHEYYKPLGCSWFQQPPPDWPNEEARKVLQPDAPAIADWLPPKKRLEQIGLGDEKAEASRRMYYLMDWLAPQPFDYWLYSHYQEHRLGMRQRIREQLAMLAREGKRRHVPVAVGEGWLSYSPLLAEFEDGPVGKTIAEEAVDDALEFDYWAIVPNSNSSPAHGRCWADVDWHKKITGRILSE